MMSKIITIVVLLTGIFCSFEAAGGARADSLLRELDEVVDNREYYLTLKEKRLSELRESLEMAKDDGTRFELLGRLVDEYHPYNTDSAYQMSLDRLAVARRMGDDTLMRNARMNIANILVATGMFVEATEIMDSIRSSDLPDYLHPYYYHIMRTLYGNLADYSAFAPIRRDYIAKTNLYRDSLLQVNEEGTMAMAINRADMLNSEGKYREAIDVLQTFISQNEVSEHDRAIMAWTMSESYGNLGEYDRQKECLLVSAISDMKSAVREYISLRQLAYMLQKEGDMERAYRFMNLSVKDATDCNARPRIVQLNDIYPEVNGGYVRIIMGQRRVLLWLLAAVTLLLLGLVAALMYVRKQMKHIADARRTIEEANDRLRQLNLDLKKSNDNLHEANQSIAENSQLKEVYIGRYMDQCMSYIDKLESYRKNLGKLMAANRREALSDAIKSTKFIDDELKAFYDNFDVTFLSLFPNFVEDFNKLLMPGESIHPKKEGTLTTELRIFALIRLGIDDSDRIAKFLRYSLTTIYNYRTKVRNKAAGDRNQLENEVMKIGRGA